MNSKHLSSGKLYITLSISSAWLIATHSAIRCVAFPHNLPLTNRIKRLYGYDNPTVIWSAHPTVTQNIYLLLDSYNTEISESHHIYRARCFILKFYSWLLVNIYDCKYMLKMKWDDFKTHISPNNYILPPIM